MCTNITTVNNLGGVDLYMRPKETGQGVTKRIWAIEMNKGGNLYLKRCGGVDQFDHLIEG